MELDHSLVDFFTRAAVGTAFALAIILFVGLGIRRRSASAARRISR